MLLKRFDTVVLFDDLAHIACDFSHIVKMEERDGRFALFKTGAF